jgi:serine-type D-Ala-D-Ala carboxypeptidase/endopeptidase (penicillin-binding protein 4)
VSVGKRSAGRPRRRAVAWVSGVVVVLLIAAGAVSWQQGWATEWWDRWQASEGRTDEPAGVAAPPEVEVDPVTRPDAVAAPATTAAALSSEAIEAALAGRLSDKDLGRHVLSAVAPLDGGRLAYDSRRGGPGLAIPASITKVVTSAAALFLLGGDHRFTTRTVLEATPGRRPPRLVLVGGGDPLLASEPYDPGEGATYDPERADAVTLAKRTAHALKQQDVRRVRFAYDESLFTGPSENPTWRADYIPDDIVSPVSALWVDEGRSLAGSGREDDPAAAAARTYVAALERRGIRVDGSPQSVVADADAREVASVAGPPLAEIVQLLLEVSDNESAEVLLRHIGLAESGDGSFEGGQQGVRRTLTANGIPMRGTVLYDGSGLSRQNRMRPRMMVDVIRWLADPGEPALRPALTGLPVAGYTGSLSDRMDQGPAAGPGRVRAKTGTLTGVTSLAGVAEDLDGNLMAFVLMADRVPQNRDWFARVAQDNAAAALGACRCGLDD